MANFVLIQIVIVRNYRLVYIGRDLIVVPYFKTQIMEVVISKIILLIFTSSIRWAAVRVQLMVDPGQDATVHIHSLIIIAFHVFKCI